MTWNNPATFLHKHTPKTVDKYFLEALVMKGHGMSGLGKK